MADLEGEAETNRAAADPVRRDSEGSNQPVCSNYLTTADHCLTLTPSPHAERQNQQPSDGHEGRGEGDSEGGKEAKDTNSGVVHMMLMTVTP